MIDNSDPKAERAQTLARIEALNAQARALAEKDPRTALELCKQSMTLAAGITDRPGWAKSLWIAAKALGKLKAHEPALERLMRAANTFEQIQDFSNLGACLPDLARTQVALGQLKEATDTHLRALRFNRALGQRLEEASNLHQVSQLLAQRGDHAASLEYQLEALELERELGRIGAQAESLQQVGASYLELGRHQEALEYLERALEGQRNVNDRRGQALSMLYMARGALELNDHRRALDHARDGLMLAREIEFAAGEVSAHRLAGEVFIRTGNPSKALRVFELARNTARNANDARGQAEALIGLARTQLALAHAPSAPSVTSSDQRRFNLYREAQQTLANVLELASQLHSRSLEYQARDLLAQVYELQGETAQALEQSKLLRQLERITRDESLEHRLIGLTERQTRRFETPAVFETEPEPTPASTPKPQTEPAPQTPSLAASTGFTPEETAEAPARLRQFERDRTLETNPFPGTNNPYLQGNVVSMVPVVRQPETTASLEPAPVTFEQFDPNFLAPEAPQNFVEVLPEFLDLGFALLMAGFAWGFAALYMPYVPIAVAQAAVLIFASLGPGYALVRAIFPRRADLTAPYLVLFSLGLASVAIIVFNALFGAYPWEPSLPNLEWSPGWLAGAYFVLIATLGGLIAAWRRWRNPGI